MLGQGSRRPSAFDGNDVGVVSSLAKQMGQRITVVTEAMGRFVTLGVQPDRQGTPVQTHAYAEGAVIGNLELQGDVANRAGLG